MPDAAIAVVVPVFDNLATLPAMADQLADALEATGRPWEVIWVDDASSDGSWPWLQTHCERTERHRALRLDRNHGQSLAVCVGLAHADPDAVVVTIDADLEYAPEQIVWMAGSVVDRWCFVAGIRPATSARRRTSKLFNAVTWALTGDGVGDVGCGFMAIGPDLARAAAASELRGWALRPYLASRASSTVRREVAFEPVGRSTTGPRARVRIAADVLAADPRPARRLALIGAVAVALRATGRCRTVCTVSAAFAGVGASALAGRRGVLRRRLAGAAPVVVQEVAARGR